MKKKFKKIFIVILSYIGSFLIGLIGSLATTNNLDKLSKKWKDYIDKLLGVKDGTNINTRKK